MHAHNICAAIVGRIAQQHTVHVHCVWPCLLVYLMIHQQQISNMT